MTEAATQTNGTTTNGAAHAPTEAPTAGKAPSLRDRMVAAAKGAQSAVEKGKLTEEAVNEGAEAGAELGGEPEAAEKDPKEAKAKKEPQGEPEENPIARIQREMRAREKARGIELEASKKKEENDRIAADLKQREDKLAQQTQQLTQMLDQFKAEPFKFLETQGYDRAKLAEHFANDGKPEHALGQRIDALEKQNKQLIEFIQQNEQTRQKNEADAQAQRYKDAESAAEQRFLADHATPEKTPSLHRVAKLSRQGNRYIVERANEVGAWFRSETGKYPSWETLAEYLEKEAADDLKADAGGAQEKAPKSAGKSTATTRTLSLETSGERRSATKPLQDMSKSERLAAMEQAARDAQRSAG